MNNWKTIQGVPVDQNAKVSKGREKFFYVDPKRSDEVIRKQWSSYFDKADKLGLKTVGDAVRRFDQQNPKNKLSLLKKQGVNPDTPISSLS